MIFSIIDLIPIGMENAISRKQLTKLCLDCGLIDLDSVDPDRDMRRLIQKAKLDWAILSLPNGGYYQPNVNKAEDIAALRKYAKREEKRAVSIFKTLKKARAVLDDCDHNRFSNK